MDLILHGWTAVELLDAGTDECALAAQLRAATRDSAPTRGYFCCAWFDASNQLRVRGGFGFNLVDGLGLAE